MKFDDAYRRKNDTVHVRESLRDEIAKQQIEMRTGVRTRERKRWFVAIPTAVAAAAAVFVAVTVGVRTGAKNAAPMADEPAAYEAAAFLTAAHDMEIEESNALDAIPESAFTDDGTDAEVPADAKSMGVQSVAPASLNDPEAVPEPTKQTIDTAATAAGIEVTDNSRRFTLHPEERTVDITYGDGTLTATIELPAVPEGTQTRTESELLPVGELLYVFGTVETSDAEDETERVKTTIMIYVLDGDTPNQIGELQQPGTFESAKLFGDSIMITSTYSITNGATVERYAVFSEIDAHGGTGFRSQRVARRK